MQPHSSRRSPAACELLETRRHLSAVTLTSLKESSVTSLAGQSVILTATTKPKSASATLLSGTISFEFNGKTLKTVPMNANHQAVLTTSALAIGTDYLTAIFNGSSAFAGSTSTAVSHTVTPANTSTTLSLAGVNVVLGQFVTLKATVASTAPGAGAPAGSVTFYDGATSLGSAVLSTGAASMVVSTLFLGRHTITATFGGSPSYKASRSSAYTLAVNLPAGLTLTSDSLQTSTVKPGSGAGAISGDLLTVNYTGYLTNGTKFDSSLNPGRTPFLLQLGAGQVIQGWEEGLVGIKVGEQRVLIIPSALGYGPGGTQGIPGNSTLVFIVQLLAFPDPPATVTAGPSLNIPIANNETPNKTDGTDFGSIAGSSSSAPASFAISIAAGGQYAIQNVYPGGANPGDFPGSLSTVSGKTVLNIKFSPTAKGTRTSEIVVAYFDVSNPNTIFTLTIPLTGIGT